MPMPPHALLQRVAILIDRDNLAEQLQDKDCLVEYPDTRHPHRIPVIPLGVYRAISERLIEKYCEVAKWDDQRVVHMGTWMFPAVHERTHTIENEVELKRELMRQWYLREVDSLQGFIIRYGFKTRHAESKATDTHLVCQMLIGAFQDEYDVCILVSDDDEFIPPIELVQNMFGKRVIHAGFQADRLRAIAFGHIPFESEAYSFRDTLFRDVYENV